MHQIAMHHSDWRRIRDTLSLIRGHADWLIHRGDTTTEKLSSYDARERAKAIKSWSLLVESILTDNEYTEGVWGTEGQCCGGFDSETARENREAKKKGVR